MAKVYTFLYSIHNLGSQIEHEFVSDEVFNTKGQFKKVLDSLQEPSLVDVRQETVDSIMLFADNY